MLETTLGSLEQEGTIDVLPPSGKPTANWTASEMRAVISTKPDRIGRIGFIADFSVEVLDVLIECNRFRTDFQLINADNQLTDEQLLTIVSRNAKVNKAALLARVAYRRNASEKALRIVWDVIKTIYPTAPVVPLLEHDNTPIDCVLEALYAKEINMPELTAITRQASFVYEKMERGIKKRKLLAVLSEEYSNLEDAPLEWVEPLAITSFLHRFDNAYALAKQKTKLT